MRTALGILIALLAGGSTRADDTLRHERELFPDVLETIAGKFVRHSPAFYEWQIKDRQARVAADPSDPIPAEALATAFLKTKQFAKAIEVLGKFAEAHPDRPETQNLLGRAFLLSGDAKKALPYLERTDQYVRWLAEYLAEQAGRRLPVAPVDPKADWPNRPRSFAVFLRGKLQKPDLDLADAQPAVAALVEFLRTGYLEYLPGYEALGDLLCYSSDPSKPVAQRLAARAYLRAGYLQNNPGVRKAFISLAEWALAHRTDKAPKYADGPTAMPVLTRLMEELEDASGWYAELSTRESEALPASPDPDRELERLYPDAPRVPDEPNDAWVQRNQGEIIRAGTIGVPALILLFIAGVGVRRLVRRDRRKEVPA